MKTLNNIFIEKINEYGSIEKYKNDCDTISKRLYCKNSQEVLDEIYRYYRFLFLGLPDVQNDNYFFNSSRYSKMMDVLKDIGYDGFGFCLFNIELLEYRTEYLKGVRSLF